jgi:hypothetical protein
MPRPEITDQDLGLWEEALAGLKTIGGISLDLKCVSHPELTPAFVEMFFSMYKRETLLIDEVRALREALDYAQRMLPLDAERLRHYTDYTRDRVYRDRLAKERIHA